LRLEFLEDRVTPTQRILPLGDSNTQGGFFQHASYRYPLWEQLQQAGYSSINFVGTRNYVENEQAGNPNVTIYPNYYTSFDRDHDGYTGWRTDQVLAILPAIAAAANPDIVLLMLGTNDIGQLGQAGIAPAIANLGQIITGLRAVNPTVDILLAEIIPIAPGAISNYYTIGGTWVDDFNAQVVALAATTNSAQSSVIAVDQFTGFDINNYIVPDGLHLSLAGETWVANNFAQALVPVFPPRVASVTVNSGAAQRSRVTQIQVNFDQLVTLPVNVASAFQLKRQDDNAVVDLTGVVANDSTTHVTLNFAGALSEFGSLLDGLYTLTIDAGQVSNSTGKLDGNKDGTGGDNYAFIGNPANGLFRLFGDSNGDAIVNSSDFAFFRSIFGLGASIFDLNSDGQTNSADFAEFRKRFGITLVP